MQKMLSSTKCQGALEYLLLAAGAILIAMIIGLAIKQAANTLSNRGNEIAQETAQN